MEKYRQSDQYYIDQYDLMTIDSLKEKDRLLQKAQHDLDIHLIQNRIFLNKKFT
jgi:hypothetical protein